MFTLVCELTIGDHLLNQVSHVKIEKSWRELDDRAVIKLPRTSQQLQNNFKVGDRVQIKLGYREVESYNEFEGYVTKIKPNIPLEIECENAAWILRQSKVDISLKSTSLKAVVLEIVRQVNESGRFRKITLDPKIDDIDLNKSRMPNSSAAEAINTLKERYGLVAFFRGHQLYVGMAYPGTKDRVNYDLERNVISHRLTFRRAEDVSIKVRATSILKNNTHFSVEVGDDNGDLRTFYLYNVGSKDKLELKAEDEIKKLKFDGFEGDLTTFLIPYAAPNMTAVVNDPDHPEHKNGSYVVDSVTTTFGTSGARRKVELGIKIA